MRGQWLPSTQTFHCGDNDIPAPAKFSRFETNTKVYRRATTNIKVTEPLYAPDVESECVGTGDIPSLPSW